MEPRGSSWEANLLTFYGPHMKRPAGRILFSPHCFQILTSSKQVAKTLRGYRGREAALVGLENHLQLKTPDEKAVKAARAIMATLENSSFRTPTEPQPWHLTVEECTNIAMLEAGPTDPGIDKQLRVPGNQRPLTGLFIATLLVQTLQVGLSLSPSHM